MWFVVARNSHGDQIKICPGMERKKLHLTEQHIFSEQISSSLRPFQKRSRNASCIHHQHHHTSLSVSGLQIGVSTRADNNAWQGTIKVTKVQLNQSQKLSYFANKTIIINRLLKMWNREVLPYAGSLILSQRSYLDAHPDQTKQFICPCTSTVVQCEGSTLTWRAKGTSLFL